MLFSSLTFLLVFLPATALLYFVPFFKNSRKEINKKNIVLLLASLVFYAWGEPIYVLLMFISIYFNYNIGIDLRDSFRSRRNPKAILVFAVVVNLLILGFFKYSGFLVDSINGLSIRSFRGRI